VDYRDFLNLGIAFGLGMLIGLQRERAASKMAGVRTFTIIAMLGVFSGMLGRDFDNPYILPAMGLALAALMLTANIVKVRKHPSPDIGQTTEVAALLLFAIGAYLVVGDRILGVVAGGVLAILLYLKEGLHNLISRLEDRDLSAIMTFAGISLVILPLLPNRTFGPLDVLNPRDIWLMVTLIVGISVVGYFFYKFGGQKAGMVSGGLLGGLISSTATTVSYARRTREGALPRAAAFVIVAASAVSLFRVLVEIGVVIPKQLPEMILPLALMLLFLAGTSLVIYRLASPQGFGEAGTPPGRPDQLRSALAFGVLYGLILLAVAFVKKEFGEPALYGLAVVSGLTDVDAITLSLSELVRQNRLEAASGWKLILMACLSNLGFKGAMAMLLGSPKLGRWIAVSFGLAIGVGLLIIGLWPSNWHL